MSDAFEQWAADKSFMLRVNDRDGYVGYVNVREMALEAWQAALQSGEPVAWQFYQDGKWFNGMPGDHRANTEAAGVPVRDLYITPQPVVPEGYVLVPVELTEEMLCVDTTVEGNSHWHGDVDISKQRLRSLWSDLLSAGKVGE